MGKKLVREKKDFFSRAVSGLLSSLENCTESFPLSIRLESRLSAIVDNEKNDGISWKIDQRRATAIVFVARFCSILPAALEAQSNSLCALLLSCLRSFLVFEFVGFKADEIERFSNELMSFVGESMRNEVLCESDRTDLASAVVDIVSGAAQRILEPEATTERLRSGRKNCIVSMKGFFAALGALRITLPSKSRRELERNYVALIRKVPSLNAVILDCLSGSLMTYTSDEDANEELMNVSFQIATQHLLAKFFGHSNAPSDDVVVSSITVCVQLGKRSSFGEKSRKILLELLPLAAQMDRSRESILMTLVDGVVELNRAQDKQFGSIDPIVSFLLALPASAPGAVRDCAMKALGELVCAAVEEDEPEVVRTLIYNLSNQLYTQKEDEVVCSNIIRSLGSIATYPTNASLVSWIVDKVMVVFVTVLSSTIPRLLSVVIVQQLVQIAIHVSKIEYEPVLPVQQGAVVRSESFTFIPHESGLRGQYRNVVDRLVSISLAPLSSSASSTSLPSTTPSSGSGAFEEIPNSFHLLALHLEDSVLRADFQERLLNLCLALGMEMTGSSSSAEKFALFAERFRSLIPAVAASLRLSSQEILNPPQTVLKLMRSTWCYLVLSGFVRDSSWNQDVSVTQLAMRSPVLLSPLAYDFLGMEQEFSSIMRHGLLDISKLYSWLGSLLPSRAVQIRSFSFAHCVFCLCTYFLENRRASSSGMFRQMFVYLSDSGLRKNPGGLPECMELIANGVFRSALQGIADLDPEFQFTFLEQEAQFLLVNICSRVTGIRSICDRWISELFERFPQIIFSNLCVTTMLDLIEAIGSRANVVGGQRDVRRIHIPSYDNPIELPEPGSERLVLLRAIESLCTVWLKLGMQRSSNELQHALHAYCLRLQAQTGHLISKHRGYAFAVSQLEDFSSAANFRGVLQMKSFHSGEMAGIRECLGVVHEATATLAVDASLITSLRKALPGGEPDQKNVEKGDKEHAVIAALLMRTGAFVAESATVSSDLIHLLVWVPVLLFTEGAAEVAVSVFRWVCAQRPDVALHLNREVHLALVWTVQNGLGLFGENSPHAQLGRFRRMGCHRILIDYMAERFEVACLRSGEELELLFETVSAALESPEALSRAHGAIVARFSLLTHALKVCACPSVAESRGVALMHRNVEAAAFHWFACPCVPFPTKSLADAEAAIAALGAFYKSIHKDVETTRRGGGSAPNGSATSAQALSERRQLLSLLLLFEMDHIAVWSQPTGQPPALLQDRTQLQYHQVSAKQWKNLVLTAWSISPELAVHLPSRFKNETVFATVEQKVQQDPLSLLHVPEAVVFLATPRTLAENSPALNFLIYWARTDPLIALSLLDKFHAGHSVAAHYATRVLSHCSSDVVISYLPQLVQALRYDTSGAVREYLITAAATDSKIAHLLIWNMECEGEQEYKTEPKFPAMVRELHDEIIEHMTEDKQIEYHKEFDFFGRVTAISGVLKPLPPEDRKQKISDELRKIPVTDSLYLPTISRAQVTGINYSNPAPLQSHAKVPIKVSFDCVRPPLTEEEKAREGLQDGNIRVEESVIFKVGDDVRQDLLALQCIRVLKQVFDDADLNLYLNPYNVIATKPGCGMIEVVKDAKSRDQLGKNTEGSLFEYFVQRYGGHESLEFQEARRNFIESMAAYSVASFILQIKDRHNGNIMVDDMGHVIHIDFGFIFDLSPGGDIKFERAPFKLSNEMIQIMGQSIAAEPFSWFIDSCCKAYLATRNEMDRMLALVSLFHEMELPCFKEKTLSRFRSRFPHDKTEREACQLMVTKIRESFDKYTTLIYDKFQAWQNGIEC